LWLAGEPESKAMPRYFFHLSFGQRVVLDEEGVELPNRLAAHAEASAVVRELSDPEIGGNPRRWAGWLLQVADDGSQFFRAPIGHPALEIVTADAQEQAGPAAVVVQLAAPQGAETDPQQAAR
jgi:hypothetical protein